MGREDWCRRGDRSAARERADQGAQGVRRAATPRSSLDPDAAANPPPYHAAIPPCNSRAQMQMWWRVVFTGTLLSDGRLDRVHAGRPSQPDPPCGPHLQVSQQSPRCAPCALCGLVGSPDDRARSPTVRGAGRIDCWVGPVGRDEGGHDTQGSACRGGAAGPQGSGGAWKAGCRAGSALVLGLGLTLVLVLA
jgi:hypothetical protein